MISTSDDGTNFYVNVSDTNAGASSDPECLNLYFDTIAPTPGSGSNFGFEVSANSADSDAFDPGPSTKYSLIGTGGTSVLTQDATGADAMITIPTSFFRKNPLRMAFTPTTSGDLGSLHLSQSYGYSVVGGSRRGEVNGDDGAGYYAVCFEKSGRGMVIMTNSSNGEDLFDPLLLEVLGDGFAPTKWEGFKAAAAGLK